MSTKRLRIRAVAALAAAVPLAALAQGESSRPVSIELQALNPPVPDDLVLEEARRVPAERKAAAYVDPGWQAPRTSWGDPKLAGTWSTDDMRAIPFDRAAALGTQEFLDEEQFIERARRQQAGSEHSENIETFHRNAWGIRSFGFSSLVVDPPNGRIPPALPAAVARGAERSAWQREHALDSAEERTLAERCIMWGHELPLTPTIYNSNVQILQAPGYVAIVPEMIPDARIVPLDGRAPAPAAVRGYTGDSVGRWEGNVLIVETTNLNGKSSMRGVPRGATLSTDTRIVEEFERVGENTLRYKFTVHDPNTWERPWSAEIPMTKIDGPLFEYACHEGNYGLANLLSGARAEEARAAAEAAAKH